MSVDFAASGEFCFDSRLRLDRLALSVLQWKMFRNGILARSPISAQGLVRTSPGSRSSGPADAGGAGVDLRAAVVSRLAQGRGAHSSRTPACCCTRRAAARCRCVRPIRATSRRSSSTCCRREADRAGLRRHRQVRAPLLRHRAGRGAGGRRSSRPGRGVQDDAADRRLAARQRAHRHAPDQHLRHGYGWHGGGGWSVTSARVVGIAHRRCVDNADHRRAATRMRRPS